jgi:hypothetical protein
MTSLFRRFFRVTALGLVALFSGVPQQLVAQEHVIGSDAIQQQLVKAAEQRDRNVESLNQFFGSATAQKALKDAGVSSAQVKNAISQLSDDELAQLASKAQGAQHDFAAGSLTNQQLTYVIIALATAVIILVIVVA